MNLLVADKAWDENGQLWFNIFNLDGFIGDRILTNWLYKPYFDVRARRYRFRILNGSVSRYFAIALVKQVQGSGGEFRPARRARASPTTGCRSTWSPTTATSWSTRCASTPPWAREHNAILPTQGIAERYDIVVDFADHGIQPGDKLYFVNVSSTANGQEAGDRSTRFLRRL